MDPRQARQEMIVGFRKEKEQAFQSRWDQFRKSPALLIALTVYTAAQGVFFLLAGWLVQDIAFQIGILHKGYPFWCYFVIIGVQLLLSAPGVLSSIGLFLLRKGETKEKQVFGCRFLRGANISVSIAGGLALLLYPTIIIGVGEILPERSVLMLFRVFVAVTSLFSVSITVFRLILRFLEDNISCRRACSDHLFLTLLIYPPAVILTMLSLPVGVLAAAALLPVMLSTEFLLFLYRRFIRDTSLALNEIDRRSKLALQDRLDPYSPYN